MAPDAIGTGTIRQLADLPTHGYPVLTLYLDLESEVLTDPAVRETHLQALRDEPQLSSAGDDLDRICALLRAQPELTEAARGLAVFSSAEADVLEATRLPRAVRPMAVLDTVPWLEPLTDLTTRENCGIAVVDAQTARLFRGGVRSLTEFVAFDADEDLGTHLQRVAGRLSRAHRRRRFAHLVIAAPTELQSLIDVCLEEHPAASSIATVDANLCEAPTVQVARVLAPMIEGFERTRERALLSRLLATHDGTDAIAIGPDQVLGMLQRVRVEVVLVAAGASLLAGVCPSCGGLCTTAPTCPRDGADLACVDAIAYAVDMAVRQGAEIVVIDGERQALQELGPIAALSAAAQHHDTDPVRPSARHLVAVGSEQVSPAAVTARRGRHANRSCTAGAAVAAPL